MRVNNWQLAWTAAAKTAAERRRYDNIIFGANICRRIEIQYYIILDNVLLPPLACDSIYICMCAYEGFSNVQSCIYATAWLWLRRWPLLIDPQLQGTRWVKQRGRDSLITVSVNRDRWLNKVIDAIRNGDVLLIENLSEAIDPVLDPLVSRSVSRKVCAPAATAVALTVAAAVEVHGNGVAAVVLKLLVLLELLMLPLLNRTARPRELPCCLEGCCIFKAATAAVDHPSVEQHLKELSLSVLSCGERAFCVGCLLRAVRCT